MAQIRSSAWEIGWCPDCGGWLSDTQTLVGIESYSVALMRRDLCVCGTETQTLLTKEHE